MKTLKQYFFLLFVVLSALCGTTSCDKLPDNGDLDGMWQLMSVSSSDGETQNVKESQLYWSIRLRLVQYSSQRSMDSHIYYSHFKKEGSILYLTDFCKDAKYEHVDDDNEWIQPDEAEVLHQWGIYPEGDPSSEKKVMVIYHIDYLSSSKLILSNADGKLTFRKF